MERSLKATGREDESRRLLTARLCTSWRISLEHISGGRTVRHSVCSEAKKIKAMRRHELGRLTPKRGRVRSTDKRSTAAAWPIAPTHRGQERSKGLSTHSDLSLRKSN